MDPQIKGPQIVWNFLIFKKICLARYQNKKRVKLKGKDIKVCFVKHTLSPKKIRHLGLRPRPSMFTTVPLFFFLFFMSDLA